MKLHLPSQWVAKFGAQILRFWGRSLNIHLHDPSDFFKRSDQNPCIWAFWHNRILMFPYIYERHCSLHPCSVLISQSRDGEWIATIAKFFGLDAVRGPTSRNSGQAYRALLRELIHKRHDVAVTPDGPRGPRYKVQPGIILLSQMSGAPIVPVTYHLHRKGELKSWDRFQLPFPFTECNLVVHELMHVPKNLSKEEISLWQKKLEITLGK